MAMALDGYRYLGDFSATPPWHSRSMSCDRCRVSWTGCWDNFQCPICGDGDLPSAEIIQLRKDVGPPIKPESPSVSILQENLEKLKVLHVELRGILAELEEAVR